MKGKRKNVKKASPVNNPMMDAIEVQVKQLVAAKLTSVINALQDLKNIHGTVNQGSVNPIQKKRGRPRKS